MPLTTDAKSRLSQTIRGLRERLIRDIGDHMVATYQLGIADPAKARLSEAGRVKRARLEAWADERVRASGAATITERRAARERFLKEAVAEAAATFLNRLVYLRLLEHMPGPDGRPLRRLRVLTGGWNSQAYREFREFAGPLLEDESEGYETLLTLVFEDLAIDLPGLYGPVGITPLIPIPISTLRHTIGELDQPGLTGAWDDDTTFGWVYQYWNDPVREALDAKINDGGKIEPHEIASKTQMFTERYMVEWLLQNSLGPTWIALCRKHGWTPDVDTVLPDLEARRAEWRAKRAAGEVTLEALMPIREGVEERWKYYVPQDIPDEAITAAPDTLRDLKLLDPACGSGHFLVIALDWLFHAYKEEARHRGEVWSDRQIVEWIVENNLHGIDIDPRAVQIAAAAVLLKARSLAPDCRPGRMNLVAPAFNLAGLPEDDPALLALLRGVEAETGLPQSLTRGVIRALEGADHLGTLLKVEQAVGDALLAHQVSGQVKEPTFEDHARGLTREIDYAAAEAALLEGIERFLAKHTGGADLGLRLDGEQLAAGIRFIRMMRPGTYHVVVANPPYLGLKKSPIARQIERNYLRFKYDLFAAFIGRALELTKFGGVVSLVTLRNWMFQNQYQKLQQLLSRLNIAAVVDLHWGAFDSMKDVSASMQVIRCISSRRFEAKFVKPVAPERVNRDAGQVHRNSSGLLCPATVYHVRPRSFSAIRGMPFIYWWNAEFRREYARSRKLGAVAAVRQGAATSDNTRFLRRPWEVHRAFLRPAHFSEVGTDGNRWVPFIMGASGKKWVEPLDDLLRWNNFGLELKSFNQFLYGSYTRTVKNESYYFQRGVAFSQIGTDFTARAHRFLGVIGHKGSSVFPGEIPSIVALLNNARARYILESLNPGIGFEVGDVNRLPIFPIEGADEIYATLDRAFTEHEAARENSVEFRRPGPSAWTYAQAWAQAAVDRPAGAPLPPYEPVYEDPAPVAWVSYALGQALGRFGRDGEGILVAAPTDALPHGMLFLSGAGTDPAEGDVADGLRHPACAALRAAWEEHGPAIKRNRTLRRWLREDFFKLHKATYETRPIWLPLSSRDRTFVAWVSIHRWTDRALDELRAGPVLEERQRLEGRLSDVKTTLADTKDPATRTRAEKDLADLSGWLEELRAFDETLRQIAEQGAPPVDGCPPRAVDARFAMDLDDGVMVNSAGLWSLLDLQWKDPRKWWAELAKAQGRKNYDWSKLAARYWPARVAEACAVDPSLAVAHGCFWRLHPIRAYAWKLRLQDEIRPDFTIDEADSDVARHQFLIEHPLTAIEIIAKEMQRRDRKLRSENDAEDAGDPSDDVADEGEAVGDVLL